MKKTALALLVTNIFCLAMFCLMIYQFHRAINGWDEAISVAHEWQDVAQRWENASKGFEEAMNGWRTYANRTADDFGVCNSMLPKEKRL